MTKEQIESIAVEYADSKVPIRETFDDDEYYYGCVLRAKEVLKVLADKYLMVEKEKVRVKEVTFAKSRFTTSEGWIARDSKKNDSWLFIYSSEPSRNDEEGIWEPGLPCDTYLRLGTPNGGFYDLKWEDEPLKVKITIEEIWIGLIYIKIMAKTLCFAKANQIKLNVHCDIDV